MQESAPESTFTIILKPSKSLFIIPIVGLLATLALFETPLIHIGDGLSLDVFFQNPFYAEGHGWLVSKEGNPMLHFLFYSGFKNGLIVFTVLCFLAFAFSFFKFASKYKKYRAQLLLVVLSVAIAPVVINFLKAKTNIYTPAQTTQYGGKAPYVRLFESYPGEFKEENQKGRGRGYPAGHASGAFSLLALAFAAKQKRFRRIGWIVGMGLGWLTGMYQQVRGEHYVSHTIITMFAVWLIVALLTLLVRHFERRLVGIRQVNIHH